MTLRELHQKLCELIENLQDRASFLISHPNEKEVLPQLRTIRRQYRELIAKQPIISKVVTGLLGLSWSPPKQRGRPPARSQSPIKQGSRLMGRPKGSYATDAYSPMSILIAWILEERLLSKREIVDTLIKAGVVPEVSDRSEADPYHRINRLARVGKETMQEHPEARHILSKETGKQKGKVVLLLIQYANEYLRPSKSLTKNCS